MHHDHGNHSPAQTHAPTVDPNAIDPALGITYAEIARYNRRLIATAEANADPLPGPLADAFPEQPIKIGKFIVRPLVLGDFPILRKLDSPLLKQMGEAGKPVDRRQPTAFTDQDEYDMIYQFILPVEDVERVLVDLGIEKFRAMTRHIIAGRMNPFLAGQIVGAIGQQFVAAFATATGHKAPTDGDTKVFPMPPAAKTGTDGGSISSPVSSSRVA